MTTSNCLFYLNDLNDFTSIVSEINMNHFITNLPETLTFSDDVYNEIIEKLRRDIEKERVVLNLIIL
jgi:hypothetical protein